MKKISVLMFCMIFAFYFANAQKWVSTTPQPRNVILEEFTGIHCGYCPDGHKRANDLVAQYPGKVFLINIHSGGYAAPANGSEPDLRTTVGSAIDVAAKVSGYPAGSVNRGTTPWAIDRGQWATKATAIMNTTSTVNVAVKSFVDYKTRVMTTEVEIYYTSASAQAKNYLTIALTQDDILGYQSDYGNYNPTNWTSDGLYRHNHVFRQLISSGGTWGESIDTTTAGHYEYRKYTTTLPDAITSIPMVFYKLNVVAFVTEAATGSNILSGAGTPVDFDQSVKCDLGLKNLTQIPSGMCFTSISPKVEVTNNSGNAVTSFDVSLFLNGVENKKSYTGSLAKGDKTTLDWGVIPFQGKGSYSVSIQGFKNVNNNTLSDMDASNDGFSASGMAFTSKAFTTISAGFNSTTAMPVNTAFDKSQNNAFSIVTGSMIGAKNSAGAIRFALDASWNVADTPGDILMGEADLTAATSPNFSYYYAYSDGQAGGSAPTITVNISKDCGITWEEIKNVTCTETGQPAVKGNWYVPKTAEYKLVNVSLSAYKGQAVLIKLSGIPGSTGNALYIDELALDATSDVNDNSNASDVFYPNPASSKIQINDVSLLGFNYSIYSNSGDLVTNGINSNNIFDVSNLSNGTYLVKFNIDNRIISKSFIIAR
ncbi:MAG: Omp28-related outer membrane protein [Candidatus Kapabacteria bacterium]|nr:Omp28-related outer membrane protein [Candidatus Kapabacteria bacterium]